MIVKRVGVFVYAKLDKGENLFGALGKICAMQRIKSGFIVFGIGTLKNFEVGYFDGKKYIKQKYKESHELIAMHGSIANAEQVFHVHAALGGKDHKVVGGHLFSATVASLVEMLIMKSGTMFTRKKNDETGLNELFFKG
ncbi:MAG: PPC domain-containing DNA-binding protein [Candidatus Micrarchaeia archaeon]